MQELLRNVGRQLEALAHPASLLQLAAILGAILFALWFARQLRNTERGRSALVQAGFQARVTEALLIVSPHLTALVLIAGVMSILHTLLYIGAGLFLLVVVISGWTRMKNEVIKSIPPDQRAAQMRKIQPDLDRVFDQAIEPLINSGVITLAYGAIGMTFETDGGPELRQRKDDGTYMTFEMGIAHHYIASLTTLATAAANRSELLRDYYEFHNSGMAEARARGMKRVIFSAEPDPARAVAVAQRAVELDAGNGTYVSTLGTAHYRAGDWRAALSALNKSLPLRNGGDSYDYFFLAMSHWQLGEKDQARSWFDKGVEWLERHRKLHPELKRFRREAAELLGIKEKP